MGTNTDISGTLAARAIAAHRADPATTAGPAWRRRAALALRTLAATLGVDPAAVVAVPDQVRRFGLLQVPDVLLTVFDAGPGAVPPFEADVVTFRFIPEYGTTSTFLLLGECPECHREVPMYRVASLSDLGRQLLLGRSTAQPPDTEQFATDPGHVTACALRSRQSRFAAGHRTD